MYVFSEQTVEELQKPEVHDYLARLSSSEWGLDLSKKPTDEGPGATFRRLSVF